MYGFSKIFLEEDNRTIFDKMIKNKLSNILIGQHLNFLINGSPNSGKSFSIFGNKLLCDSLFLNYIENEKSKYFLIN